MKWAERSADETQALREAVSLQRDAATLGFDWPELEPLWDKLQEEILELKEAVAQNDEDAIESELGDLFFMLVNFARFLNKDPGAALNRTNSKFINRLRYIEQAIDKEGKDWSDCSLDELEAHWQAAKSA